MEYLFMAFMVVVSVTAVFAVAVVLRDIYKENAAKKKPVEESLLRIEGILNEMLVTDEQGAPAVATIAVVEEPVKEPVEVPAEVPAEEPAPVEEDDGKISFSAGQQQTLEEKYMALSAEARGWYDEIVKYAASIETTKRYKNLRYEEYKIGKERVIRLLIKRGIINCEFHMNNLDFKTYIDENKIAVKRSATTLLVENRETVDAAKSSIDIAVAAIAEEKEYKKQQAREKRRAARAEANAAQQAAQENTTEA